MDSLKVTFGLKNHEGKYLTCESLMGGRLNCQGKSLKKKQIWSFQAAEDASQGVFGYFVSSTGLYLTAKPDGKCNAEPEASSAAVFEIRAYDDGRWVLVSKLGSPKEGAQQYYFGGSGETLDSFNKVSPVAGTAPPADRMWTVQLAMHPQVCIKNVNKKKYVHLSDDGQTLNTNEIVPWGDDALITLIFFPEGRYGIQAANGNYLSASGALKQDADDSCKFVLEIRGSQYAFKCVGGGYLSSATGPMKQNRPANPGRHVVTKDELYEFEDSHPQIKMTDYAGRKVSVKHGVEFTANSTREAEDDTIRFQLEAHPEKTGLWAFRTHKDKYWSLANDADGSVHCDHDAKSGFSSAQYFTIEWMGASMAIKASNGKYITSSANGALRAIGASSAVMIEDKCSSQYVWELINRPRLVIRTEHGFVNTTASGALVCNSPNPEVFDCHVTKGLVQIASSNGKYWTNGPSGLSASGSSPTMFEMCLLDNTNMTLSLDGKLFQAFQNGAFTATGSKVVPPPPLEF
jgi:fascin 1/2